MTGTHDFLGPDDLDEWRDICAEWDAVIYCSEVSFQQVKAVSLRKTLFLAKVAQNYGLKPGCSYSFYTDTGAIVEIG